jgi:hypothetical protein
LGFLGGWPLRRENPHYRGWVSLDFLGFSGPKRDLSMGYTDILAEIFSSRLSPGVRGDGTGEAIQSAGLFMGQAYFISDFLQ